MNDTITSREDLLLAKVAGKDIDINTMTPPVAMNQKEKLLLDIAKRLDGFATGGSGSGSSGNVLIISGTIEYDDVLNKYLVTINKTTEEIYAAAAAGSAVILNVEDDDSFGDWLLVYCGEGKDGDIYVNFASIDESKNGVSVKTLTFYSDSDGEEPEEYAVATVDAFAPYEITATLGQNESQKVTLTFSKTAAEVFAVCNEGRPFKICFKASEDVDVECVCFLTGIKTDVEGTITYMFRVDTDKTYVCSGVEGDEALVMTEI